MTEPKEEDPEREKQATEGEQTEPRISGGPDLTPAQLSEDDDKRPEKKV
jgi:hypothetical protein